MCIVTGDHVLVVTDLLLNDTVELLDITVYILS